MIKHINYRSQPELFSNKCVVSLAMLEELARLIEGYDPIDINSLLTFAVLAEAVVFHENIIVEDTVIIDASYLPSLHLSDSTKDLITALERGNVIEAGYDTAGNEMYNEGSTVALLSLVLKQCKSPEDIPSSLLDLRERYRDLRKKCTSLELELRRAQTLSDQIAIVKEIEVAYESLSVKVFEPSRRLLLRLFDIVKELDPLSMSVEVLSQTMEYLADTQTLLKMPGYYDLWKASIEVGQGLPLLNKIFGNQITPQLLKDLNRLKPNKLKL